MEESVLELQFSTDLRVTDIADPITWEVLEEKATGPLQNRMYREDVIPLKVKLEFLGFGSFNLTDLFAAQTERAVRDFQSYYQDYYDLTVSGVVDTETLASLEELVNSPFQYENRHEYTGTLKDQMYILGFWDSKNGTSLYGSRTERAIRDFQSAYGLRESGIADPKTQNVLETEANGPLKNPMYREDARELKENLEKLGFGSFNLTDYYGPQTERAVREFQSYYQDYRSEERRVGKECRSQLRRKAC